MIHVGNEEHGQNVMRATGSDYSKVTMEVISRSENGIFYGGVVYENYTGKGGSVLTHIAGTLPNWLNRDMMFIMFDYPFVQLDCTRVFAQVASKNVKSRQFCKSVGFKELVTLEGVFPDDDMLLLELKRENCRFLNIKPRNIYSRRTQQDGQT